MQHCTSRVLELPRVIVQPVTREDLARIIQAEAKAAQAALIAISPTIKS